MKTKKITAWAIVLGALFVILLAVYLIFVRPLVSTQTDPSAELELLDGEVRITDKLSNFYIFEPLKRASIRSIKVENEYGGYLVEQSSSGVFSLDGYPGVPFDDEMLSSLIVSTGTPVAMMRVAQNLGDDPAALAEYGLDDPQASWTLTSTDGKAYRIYVGDRLLTDGGYYVKYADRDAVYIVSTTLADTVLADRCALISPVLITGLTENNYYYADSFAVTKGEELSVLVERVPEELMSGSQLIEFKLSYPRPENNTSSSFYVLDTDTYLDVLYSFIDLRGSKVVSFIPSEADIEKYGLSDPEHAFILTYGSAELTVFTSAKQDSGVYYATSSLYGYGLICEVPASALAWLDYDQIKWIEDMPFYEDIRTVSRITVKGYGESTVDLDFTLNHTKTSSDAYLLDVTEENSGKIFPNNDVSNFRNYYITLMNITNQEYATISDEDKEYLVSDNANLLMKMTYENQSGEVFEYGFYKYYENSTSHLSGGKVFVTVNGVGEFYTTNDLVEKALSDANRLMNGLDIDSFGKH